MPNIFEASMTNTGKTVKTYLRLDIFDKYGNNMIYK